MFKTRVIPLIVLLLLSIHPSFSADEDSSGVKRAFFSSESIDIQDSQGRTSLMRALIRQDKSTAFLLLNIDADTALRDKNGQTALYYALQFSEDEELLEILIENILDQEGSLNIRDGKGRTPLEIFVARGKNPAFIQLLGQAGAEALSSSSGENLLFSAIRRDESFKSEIMESLVWIGFSLNDRNSDGRTPSEEAAFNKDNASSDLLDNIRSSLSEELIHSLYFSGEELTLTEVEERVLRGASPSYRSEQGFTPCHYAVAAGRPDILEFLLNSNEGINPFTEDSRKLIELIIFFPLDYEVETALSLMTILMDKGLPVNLRTEEGITLLNAAIRHSEELASLLLSRGADPNQRDPGAVSAMMTAMTTPLKEDGTLLEELTTAGADLKARDDKGGDILSYAIVYGQGTPIIKRLLSLGIDADARDDFGTPGFFWAAAFSADKDLSTYLMSGNKQFLWRDKDGWNPLMGALNFANSPDVVEQLAGLYTDGRMLDGSGRDLKLFRERYRQYYGDQPLPELESLIKNKRIYPALAIPYDFDPDEELRHILEYGSDPDMINLFIDEGADPAKFYTDGFTPLMTAVAFNSYEIIETLLNAGAPLFDTTPYGWTALHLAAWQNDSGTATLLLDKGWDVNVRDFENWTPLHWAARNGASPDYLQTLFDRGADPGLITYRKDTVLHLACSAWVSPISESLAKLLDKGVDIDAVNALGETALMLAAGMGYYETCIDLLNAGADKTVMDELGETASTRAYKNGLFELSDMLLEMEE
jgi:ankyrin repeat protein